jgi:hypothetical protein
VSQRRAVVAPWRFDPPRCIGISNDARAHLPRGVGPRPGHPLIGFLGDIDLAEEAAQEAFAIAAHRWPRDGVGSARVLNNDGSEPNHGFHLAAYLRARRLPRTARNGGSSNVA